MVKLTTDSASDYYTVREIDCEIGGRGFAWTKSEIAVTETVYHVRVTPDNTSCDCPGGTYRGRCKHADATVKLIELGRL